MRLSGYKIHVRVLMPDVWQWAVTWLTFMPAHRENCKFAPKDSSVNLAICFRGGVKLLSCKVPRQRPWTKKKKNNPMSRCWRSPSISNSLARWFLRWQYDTVIAYRNPQFRAVLQSLEVNVIWIARQLQGPQGLPPEYRARLSLLPYT